MRFIGFIACGFEEGVAFFIGKEITDMPDGYTVFKAAGDSTDETQDALGSVDN